MRLIEVDELFLFIEGDPGLGDPSDPFSGLGFRGRRDLLPALDAYRRWEEDQLLVQSIAESKAVGTVAFEPFSRGKRYSQMASRPSYAREVRYELSAARKTFDKLQAEARSKLLRMAHEFEAGAYTAQEFQRLSAELLASYYERIFNTGRKASGLVKFMPKEIVPTQWERSWLRSAVRQEIAYWTNFVAELAAGEVQFAPKGVSELPRPPRRRFYAEERIEMFIKSMESMFDSARVTGLPDNSLIYWSGPGIKDKRICEGCQYVVERQPFPKELLPAVPRAGMTPCRTNCRHRLLVRQADSREITRRKRALPKRTSMVAAMEEIMKRRGGGRRRLRRMRGALTNPWGKR